MRAEFFIYLAVMFAVTYAIRVLPLALIRKKIKSRFMRSFLAYIPYTVLGAMTFPAIFYSVDNIAAAAAGTDSVPSGAGAGFAGVELSGTVTVGSLGGAGTSVGAAVGAAVGAGGSVGAAVGAAVGWGAWVGCGVAGA